MNLNPGESTPMLLPIPTHIAEAVLHGAELTVEHGPILETSPRHYERMVELLLDGKPAGSLMLAWDSKPMPWYERAWRWILRRPPKCDPGEGLRIGCLRIGP